MVGLTREQRAAREAERLRNADDKRLDEAKADPAIGPWGVEDIRAQRGLDARNERDERHPDWRPSTLADIPTQTPAPDERGIPGDLGKAVNIMAQRAVSVPTDPTRLPGGPPEIRNPDAPIKGEKIRLLRGYQPEPEQEGGPLPPKRQPGEVIGLPAAEAKRLRKLGVAKALDD